MGNFFKSMVVFFMPWMEDEWDGKDGKDMGPISMMYYMENTCETETPSGPDFTNPVVWEPCACDGTDCIMTEKDDHETHALVRW